MKLELKHLAPYLPYGLQVKLEFADNTELPWYYEDKELFTLEGMMLDWYNSSNITVIKPILKPLSGLHLIFNDFVNIMPFGDEYKSNLFLDEIKHTEKTDLFIIKSKVCPELIINKSQPLTAPYLAIQVMLENHYDVFGLIDAGLAIDKTIIK